jgi:hypothetical protein
MEFHIQDVWNILSVVFRLQLGALIILVEKSGDFFLAEPAEGPEK